ncbi:MAG TPA: SUMF1/EgtB/PvdO family nonheme iron enzyme [Roseiflexaceae bacterium]|nr:SUMF1/EgtB/PvdO family nonheme iron enzyme [Roseiflexaceae bacterium]
MTQPHNPFTHTGALRPGHPLFRGREELMQRLEKGCVEPSDSFIILYGGRRNGKTSMLLWLEQRLSERVTEGVAVCRVSFQGLPSASTTEVCRHLARSVAHTLPRNQVAADSVDVPTLLDFFGAALAPSAITRFVLLLDELGSLGEATRTDLASMLSDLHTRRLHNQALAKMQVLIAGGVELLALVSVEASALRNVSRVVRLDDLTEQKAVALLAAGLEMAGAPSDLAEQLGRLVYTRVRGHPYVTQRLGDLLAEHLLEGERPDEDLVEELCRRLLEDDDALMSHLRQNLSELGLENAARQLLSATRRTTRTDVTMARLELLGLARRGERYWEPRNPLLVVAMAEWVGLPLPDGPLLDTAQAVQQTALQRLLAELRLEEQAATNLVERATTLDELVLLSRRATELADEITRIEAIQPTQATKPLIQIASRRVKSRAARSLPLWVPALVKVPAGSFLMGSTDADTLADDGEKPQHRLELPNFWIGRTPVTYAQFRPFAEGDGYTNRAYWTTAGWTWRLVDNITQPFHWGNPLWLDDHPMIGLCWFEAVAYCRWLSAQTGHPFRLPSEAEWEKAARGTDGRIWPWGSVWEPHRCNSVEQSQQRVGLVGSFPDAISPCGALDMAGTVWEWCATQHGQNYPYQLEDEWTERYLEGVGARTMRGGAFYSDQATVRGAYRDFNNPYNRRPLPGLRVVSDLPRPDAHS